MGINNEFLKGNNNYLDELYKSAELNEVSVGGLDVFPAAKQMTVTKFAARKFGVPAIQLEINRNLREPEKESKAVYKAAQIFKRIYGQLI